MASKHLTAAAAALILSASLSGGGLAFAQHGGGGHGEGGHGGGGHGGGGFHGGGDHGGGGFHGGGYHGGGYHHGYGGLGAGLALGAILGYYGGHPYYCRNHHHWRWSPYYGRYVYYYGGGYC